MTSTMHIDLRIGQTLFIGDAQVTLLQKSGQLARLHVQAPRSIVVNPPNRRPSAPEGVKIVHPHPGCPQEAT